LAAELPLVKRDVEKISRKVAHTRETWRRAEDERQRSDEWERTWLHMRYNGRILADIKGLDETDADGKPIEDNIRARERFRRKGWKV
jgi:hypothetical protein